MALTLESINKVRERTRIDSAAKVGIANALRGFFKHANDVLKNPDLQLVTFQLANAADTVIANVACKLHFLALTKPAASTVNAWVKGSNHATTAAANGDIVVFLVGTSGGGRGYGLHFGDGLPLGTGLTLQSHTTVNGNTASQDADCAYGFAIVGAA